jgi:AcrR family transcriptional regulator
MLSVPRPRSARALTNDQAIRTAAVQLIFNKGIDSISFRDVGQEAGLTHGALYARFEDVDELLIDLWASVLRDRAISMFTAASDAALNPTHANVHAVIETIRDASTVDAVTVQVLLASRRFPILQEEVENFVRDFLETSGAEVSDAVQSRALVLFALMIIVILSNSQFGPDVECLDFLESILRESLAVDVAEVASIAVREPSDRLIAAPKPDLRSQLTFHTFSAVGRSGYMRATISRISRRANCSPGSIYKIYPSKEDLTIAAIRAVLQAPGIALAHFNDILEEGAIAQLLYSSASAQNDVRKSFTLEVAMASAYSEKLRRAVQAQLRQLESVVPLISGLDEKESAQLGCMMRSLILLTLGVSFLSTATKATDQVDFNQFAEPLRRAFVNQAVPRWPEIQQQLGALAERARAAAPTNF